MAIFPSLAHTGIRRTLARTALTAALLGALAQPAAAQIMKVRDVSVLPPILYRDENGVLRRFNPRDHKLTALHFWAMWCVPCVKELPQLEATAEAYADKGFHVLALSQDGDGIGKIAKVRHFLMSHGVSHIPAALDPGSASFRAAGARGVPTTLFVDSDGDIIGSSEGPMDWADKDARRFIEKTVTPEAPTS